MTDTAKAKSPFVLWTCEVCGKRTTQHEASIEVVHPCRGKDGISRAKMQPMKKVG